MRPQLTSFTPATRDTPGERTLAQASGLLWELWHAEMDGLAYVLESVHRSCGARRRSALSDAASAAPLRADSYILASCPLISPFGFLAVWTLTYSL